MDGTENTLLLDGIDLFSYTLLVSFSIFETKQARLSCKCRAKSVIFLFLLQCFDIFSVGGKVFYCYVIVSFEKSSNLDSLKLPLTNVCLWKSTQTILHSKYSFCSKNANQTGNTSSLLVHCLKQYPVISCSHG